jgi:hypothetical protein
LPGVRLVSLHNGRRSIDLEALLVLFSLVYLALRSFLQLFALSFPKLDRAKHQDRFPMMRFSKTPLQTLIGAGLDVRLETDVAFRLFRDISLLRAVGKQVLRPLRAERGRARRSACEKGSVRRGCGFRAGHLRKGESGRAHELTATRAGV